LEFQISHWKKAFKAILNNVKPCLGICKGPSGRVVGAGLSVERSPRISVEMANFAWCKGDRRGHDVPWFGGTYAINEFGWL